MRGEGVVGSVAVREGAARWIFGALLAAVGLYLLLGGVYLASLGGSLYYLPAGIAILAVAGLVVRRQWSLAGRVYLALLLLSVGWSIWEVGLDGWALAPRLGMLACLGIPIWAVGIKASPRVSGLALAVLACLVPVVLGAFSHSYSSRTTPSTAERVHSGSTPSGEWSDFSNGNRGTRFSPLTQINTANAGRLRRVWTHEIEMPVDPPGNRFEAVPLKVGDMLYACTSTDDVVALDAETGALLWQFTAQITGKDLIYAICRGTTYYKLPYATGACSQRVYTNTIDGRLIALDAETGLLCSGFGANGQVNLLYGLGQRIPGYFYATSAPTLFNGKLLVNGAIADGQYVGEPSGVVRAYDAVSGALAWAWDLGRPGYNREPEEPKTYTLGTANSWAPASFDADLGLVYVATGNATPDYVYGHRSLESLRYSSAVVALDADTGSPRWSFQTTHYDVWDYDVGSQPVLVDLRRDEASAPIPALIQPTKRGELFVLDRRTGKPLFPVVEQRVPQSGGVEKMSATQPASPGLPYLGGPKLTERDMWGISPLDQLWCRIRFRQARYEGPMTPPGLTASIADPGYIGGMDWGSTAVDPDRQVAVVASNRIVNYIRLITRAEADARHLKPAAAKGADLGGSVAQAGTPYGAIISAFLSPLAAPCQRPPFGLISGIDLRTGKLLWSHPLGTARDLGPMGLRSHLPFTIGTPTIGGPMTTASGLTFVGGSQDSLVRAYDTRTGRMLWSADLPYMSQTFPMSFYSRKSGRQFIAISVGEGTVVNGVRKAAIVAFALPVQQ
jgi:quinoprotein glucose dehydrogenase